MRKAFTLIELLVVISILAILAALSVAMLARVHTSQREANTKSDTDKLQLKLRGRTAEITGMALSPKNPYRPQALLLCNGDAQLADSLLCYAYLRVNLPETFAEAKVGFPMLSLPPASRFEVLPNVTTLIAGDQNATLLTMILDDGEIAPMRADPTTGYKYYQSFDKPFQFERFAEQQAGRDAYDPAGKLATWTGLPTLRTQANCINIGNNRLKVPTVFVRP